MQNITITFQALGGVGIFLLGMVIMTNGLHAMASSVIRRYLMRFTNSPSSGAMTGAVSTALLQSSSATTVAAVGFVGAGLLSFPEALGIIFGANLGTTVTGWLVVLLGFKLKLGTLMLPVILVGVLLKLFGRGKWKTFGLALAGFGLIFVGIHTMQEGMAQLEQWVTPEQFPPDTWIGRIKLMLIGILITLLTQSSSSGVAAAITAVAAGAINFNQAAAIVIGMDIGTTVTAVLASVGGTVASRRTGLSHMIFNFMTGVMALLLITPYTAIWEAISPGSLSANAEIGLVGFHTFFNLIGLLLVLPFANHFARLIKYIIKPTPMSYAEGLDRSLLKDPEIALTAIWMTIQAEFIALLNHLRAQIQSTDEGTIELDKMQVALNETHEYIDQVEIEKSSTPEWQQLVTMIHMLDHMQRLHERLDEDIERLKFAQESVTLFDAVKSLELTVMSIIEDWKNKNFERAASIAKIHAQEQHENLPVQRDQIFIKVASGQYSVNKATNETEAVRWLLRVSHHISRVCDHGGRYIRLD